MQRIQVLRFKQSDTKGGELKIEKQMREVVPAPDVCGDVCYQPVVWKLCLQVSLGQAGE